jgi:hypothetical protein
VSGPRSSRFSPHLVAPERLEALLVGRAPLLAELVDSTTRTVGSGAARYELLVGPRGAGKSHVLAVLVHRIRAQLSDVALVVALDEEEHVASLVDLLVRVLRRLPVPAGQPDTRELELSLRRQPTDSRAVQFIHERLLGRPLVLALENLDRIFAALGTVGQQRLRAILQEQGSWSVLATSQTAGPEFLNQDRPFYRMFNLRELSPLSVEQCQEMLILLADTHDQAALAQRLRQPEGLARVRAIHHVIGGSPRAVAMTFPYLTVATLDQLELAFYGLADDLTPYYQEQIRARSAGQQAVLEALAEAWQPLAVHDISDATYNATGSTGTHLRQLSQDRLVQALTVGRERFYEIADPLWRIARAMKRPDQAPVAMIRFLRFWHTRDELRLALAAPDVEPDQLALWSAALKGQVEEGLDAWSRRMVERIEAARAAGDKGLERRLAEEFYDRKPCPASATQRLMAVSHDKLAFEAIWPELSERFGGNTTLMCLYVAVLHGVDLDGPAFERAWHELDDAELDGEGRQIMAVVRLASAHGSPTEMDAAVAAIDADTPAEFTAGLLHAMSARQPPTRLLQVCDRLGPAPLGILDEVAVARALAAAGQPGSAIERMKHWEELFGDVGLASCLNQLSQVAPEQLEAILQDLAGRAELPRLVVTAAMAKSMDARHFSICLKLWRAFAEDGEPWPEKNLWSMFVATGLALLGRIDDARLVADPNAWKWLCDEVGANEGQLAQLFATMGVSRDAVLAQLAQMAVSVGFDLSPMAQHLPVWLLRILASLKGEAVSLEHADGHASWLVDIAGPWHLVVDAAAMASLTSAANPTSAANQLPPYLLSRLPWITLRLAAARLVTGRPSADLAAIALSLPAPWPAVLEALLAVPSDVRPYATLPESMRQIVRNALESQGPEAQPLLDRLPVPGA